MSFPFDLQNDHTFSFDHHNNIIEDKFSLNVEEFGTTNQMIKPNGAENCVDLFKGDNHQYESANIDHQESLFSKPQLQQEEINSDYGLLDYPQCNIASPSVESRLEEISKFGQTLVPNGLTNNTSFTPNRPYHPFSLASLELLNSHGTGFRRLTGRKIVDRAVSVADHRRRSSTEEILRIAGARFIQTAAPTSHPFEGSLSGISSQEAKDIELVEALLASAEKVGRKQHESAARLLKLCENSCSNTGSPVQRVVYYFCEALRERIDRESGKKTHQTLDISLGITVPDASKLAFHRGLPFSQAEKAAAALTIAEKVSQANRVHVIDIRIGFGIHWTTLMEALSSRREFPVERLKITAVETPSSKHSVQEAGKWLSNFAYALKMPFEFKTVMLSDILSSPDEDVFEIENDETVAVYSSYGFSRLIPRPDQLEALMRAVRGLKPRVVVVAEVEAEQNSAAFFTRFVETLFYYGASFDFLEVSMRSDDTNRVVFEALYCGAAIRNIVAAEGMERLIRNVKIGVWRAFFERFGMEETELSGCSIVEAKRILSETLDSCSFEMDGKCLIMGWKGTPLHSLSAWTFL